ncbi:MAG: hypothetical protein QNJ44_20795 [Rhodobacter sp.]|nr:hypothetical protein [Rhodobacter sp.]
MTRTFIFATATIAALGTTTLAPTRAEAKIETLEQCYNAVITWCNETFPDMDCSNASGLDECDEVFGDKVGGGAMDRLQAAGGGQPGRATLKIAPVQIRPVRASNR